MAQCNDSILVVQEVPKKEHVLANYLKQAGYQVAELGDNADLLDTLHKVAPALIVLDLSRPGVGGVTLALKARRVTNAGIIFVSAHNSEFDRIAALELVGDDYVTKPVNLRELLARVRSVLRRCGGSGLRQTAGYTFTGYHLDMIRRGLFNTSGDRVAVTPGEFNLLAALVVYRGEAVSRRYLLEAISSHDPLDSGPRSVDTLIRRLRCKLEQNPDRPTLILTVHGVGYRLS